MPESEFILPMAKAYLRVAVKAPRWWEWTITADGVAMNLGADTLEPPTRRLLEGLTGDSQASGEIDGRPVSWVFSLSERHHSLYVATDGADRLLYFQDQAGHVAWRDRLLASDLPYWRGILTYALRTG